MDCGVFWRSKHSKLQVTRIPAKHGVSFFSKFQEWKCRTLMSSSLLQAKLVRILREIKELGGLELRSVKSRFFSSNDRLYKIVDLTESTVEKWKIHHHWKKRFVKSTSLVKTVKTLVSRNFCQRCVTVNFRDFHTHSEKTRNSLPPLKTSNLYQNSSNDQLWTFAVYFW